MYKCEGCSQHYPLLVEAKESPKRREWESCEKKKKLRRKIEQDSNEKLQKMTEIIFSNNNSLKRNYEKFMRYHHDYFMSVPAPANLNPGKGPVRPPSAAFK